MSDGRSRNEECLYDGKTTLASGWNNQNGGLLKTKKRIMDANDEGFPQHATNSLSKDSGVSPSSKTAGNFIDGEASSNKNFSSDSPSLSGILQRLLGCLKPVWTILGKATKEQKTDIWIIPFDEISELEWLGSGAQGAVFLGQYGGQQVAVKKVRREADTDIKHLRNINHPNIVKFR